MEIILVSKTPGAHGPVRIRWWGVALLSLSAIALTAALAYAGFSLGQMSVDFRPELSRALVKEQIRQQGAQVDLAIKDAEENVNALALKLGEMQAHMIRLDALGERLVDMAKLDPGEFDFKVSPARGGPNPASALESYSVPDFVASLGTLSAQLDVRAPQLAALEEFLMSEMLQDEVHPAGRPVVSGWISSGYGKRTDPLSGKRAVHYGLDFAGRSGSSVVSVAAGVVIRSQYYEGLGNIVELHHGNDYVTRYAHNKKNLVKLGETVKKGQAIATMGNSGRSTGPHVHFEVLHNGKPVNPIQYVRTEP